MPPKPNPDSNHVVMIDQAANPPIAEVPNNNYCFNSQIAQMHNVSTGLASVINGILSTNPFNINATATQRLIAVIGAELTLYSIPPLFISYLGGMRYHNTHTKMSDILRKTASFFTAFGFVFDTECRIAAEIWGKSIPSSQSVNVGVVAIMAFAFLFGFIQYRGGSQLASNFLRNFAISTMGGLSIGNFLSRISRLQEYFPISKNNYTLKENIFFDWLAIGSSVLFSLILASYLYRTKKQGTIMLINQFLALVNNFFYDIGTLFETIVYKNKVATGMIIGKAIITPALYCCFFSSQNASNNQETRRLLPQSQTDTAEDKIFETNIDTGTNSEQAQPKPRSRYCCTIL